MEISERKMYNEKAKVNSILIRPILSEKTEILLIGNTVANYMAESGKEAVSYLTCSIITKQKTNFFKPIYIVFVKRKN